MKALPVLLCSVVLVSFGHNSVCCEWTRYRCGALVNERCQFQLPTQVGHNVVVLTCAALADLSWTPAHFYVCHCFSCCVFCGTHKNIAEHLYFFLLLLFLMFLLLMPQGWKQRKNVIKMFSEHWGILNVGWLRGNLLFTIYCIKFNSYQIRNWFLSLSLFNLTLWLTQERQHHKSRGHLWIFFSPASHC